MLSTNEIRYYNMLASQDIAGFLEYQADLIDAANEQHPWVALPLPVGARYFTNPILLIQVLLLFYNVLYR